MKKLHEIFNQGASWEADKVAELMQSRKVAWRVAFGAITLAAIAVIALASITPLRRTIPYLVMMNSETGNVEVLETFDNRKVGTTELMNKHWARRYVQAREQYNWFMISGDHDLVMRLTDQSIVGDYKSQFEGPSSMDKVFGDFTERRINILSVAASPTMLNQMVVRFERTTVSKGALAEPPTTFVVNMTFRYVPKTVGPEAELMLNPLGFQVFAYRRDAESTGTAAPKPTTGGAL